MLRLFVSEFGGMVGLCVLVQTLMTASPPDDDFDCSIAQLPDNMSKNRFKKHLPGMSSHAMPCHAHLSLPLSLQLMITGLSSQQMAINLTTSVLAMLM